MIAGEKVDGRKGDRNRTAEERPDGGTEPRRPTELRREREKKGGKGYRRRPLAGLPGALIARRGNPQVEQMR